MEWVLIMVPSIEVRTSDLPIQPAGASAVPEVGLPWSGPLKEAREAFEREFIRRALGRHGGNVSRTAEELEIERRHLYRRLATLGMQKESDHGHDQ